MKFSDNLILRANEIYHDIEGGEYENKHPEIFNEEKARWENIGAKYLSPQTGNITILDIGVGTGFVPLQLGKFLKSNDLFYCTDISAEMLKIAEKNINTKKFLNRFVYFKYEGEKINLPDSSLDLITLNSVLHHLPNLTSFFMEIDRLLKNGGRLIIGHEPNKLFLKNNLLYLNLIICSLIFQPKQIIKLLAKKLHFYNLLRNFLQKNKTQISAHEKIVAEVNETLLREKLISKPLTPDDLTEIVDINAPAGINKDTDSGFDINQVIKQYLPNFEIEYFETYQHIKDLSHLNLFLRWYDQRLNKSFSKNGANFTAVLKKT